MLSMLAVLVAPTLAGDVVLDPGKGRIEVSTESLDFGLAQGTRRKSFTIANVGTAPLRITQILEDEVAFDIEGVSPPVDIAPGHKIKVTVVYEPRTVAEELGILNIYSTDLEHLEVAVQLLARSTVSDEPLGPTLRAQQLDPYDWRHASLWLGAEVQPTYRPSWSGSVVPRLQLGVLSPWAGGRLIPALSVGYLQTRTHRVGADNRIGRYDYVGNQYAVEGTAGFKIRIFRVAEPVSPELGFEGLVRSTWTEIEGLISGTGIGPLAEHEVAGGARLSAGIVGQVSRTGMMTGHVGVDGVFANGALVGGSLATTVFATVGYRGHILLSR